MNNLFLLYDVCPEGLTNESRANDGWKAEDANKLAN